VLLADRWEPSSKRCSGCGWIDEDLTLSDQTFHCEACGLVLDRDLNAAINLGKLAGSLSDSLNACGAESAGSSRKAGVQLSAKRGPRARKKQERNAEPGVSRFG
jgi:putative transposase